MLDHESATDAELIGAARDGSDEAYAALYQRHYDAALRTARWRLFDASLAEDVVADSFSAMLQLLRAGRGPDEAFRPYLLTCVSRRSLRMNQADDRELNTDSIELFEKDTDHADPVMESFESELLGQAFRSLPERWQLVLWHLEIEGAKPADLAVQLGSSANAVSAIGVRAREGLRAAYLSAHLNAQTVEGCDQADRTAAYLRGSLSAKKQQRYEEHLEQCSACFSAVMQLKDVSAAMHGVIAPLFLGTGAAAFLGWLPVTGLVAGAAGAGAAGAGAAGAGAAAAPKPGFLGSSQGVTLAVVGAAVAAAAVVGGVAVAGGFFGAEKAAVSRSSDGGTGGGDAGDAAPAGSGGESAGGAAAAPAPPADAPPPAAPAPAEEAPEAASAPAAIEPAPAPAPEAPVPEAPVPGAPVPEAPLPAPAPSAPLTVESEPPAEPATPSDPEPTGPSEPVPATPPAPAPSAPASPAPETSAPAEPSPSPTTEPTPVPTPSPSPSPTPTPTVEPTPSPSPTPEPSPSPTLVPEPTPTPEPVPTPEPTLVPSPTPAPTLTPEPIPSPTPTLVPSPIPDPTPTVAPTLTIAPTPPPSCEPAWHEKCGGPGKDGGAPPTDGTLLEVVEDTLVGTVDTVLGLVLRVSRV
ncbi:sigma-70 family RNA polymerase sigma factor [Zhihengliuella sp.]|uniref:sigma-70 family RNA polymerase sigma factor n=1 Tax=Zhihengliuella sp. TaxID=1954483 RepID=UPI002811A3DD|nr:sigma-70 family RNA polymerase sigma factor [Zhihengliuella sp.]